MKEISFKRNQENKTESNFFSLLINHTALLLCLIRNWLFDFIHWCPTSAFHLKLAEDKLLSYLDKKYRGYYVDIGPGWGSELNKIWTIEIDHGDSEDKDKAPLILLHGFGAGVGIWTLNLDTLATDKRRIIAIDILGFGRSSRPYFDSEEIEWQLVESIEKWRSKVGLNSKFILLGHGFGAYLSISYALHFPEHIASLLCVDPWGIPSRQQAQQSRKTSRYTIPLWVKVVNFLLFQSCGPLAALRLAGPWGMTLLKKIRPDIRRKFQLVAGTRDSNIIMEYVYHCNVQRNPSGESAFKALSEPQGWAKHPMIHRIDDLQDHINVSFIYGSRSWNDRQPAFQIKYLLDESRVNVHIVKGAGHHVYADKADEFNELVNHICIFIDEKIKSEYRELFQDE